MHRIFSGDGWLEVLGIRVASGKAFAFEPGFVEKDEPSHRHASRVTGASQRVQVDFQRIRPPDTSQRTIGTAPPGSAGVSPACCPLDCRSVFLRCGSLPLLPAGTAWARPKQSLGALAGRPGGRRWPRLREELCGRDARAPGGLYSMTSSNQRISIRLRVYSCSFVVRLHLIILCILCIHVQ